MFTVKKVAGSLLGMALSILVFTDTPDTLLGSAPPVLIPPLSSVMEQYPPVSPPMRFPAPGTIHGWGAYGAYQPQSTTPSTFNQGSRLDTQSFLRYSLSRSHAFSEGLYYPRTQSTSSSQPVIYFYSY